MIMKMSDVAAKVQKAINIINQQASKILLNELLMDLNQRDVIVSYLKDYPYHHIAIDKQEIIKNSDGELITLLKLRLISMLLEIKSGSEQDLKKLGYVESRIEHIQEL